MLKICGFAQKSIHLHYGYTVIAPNDLHAEL